MTFSISFPSILSSTIKQKDLGESYNDLFSFGIIIDVNVLKCKGQCPKLIWTLAMLIIELKHISSLIICLSIFHEILLGPGADELLHLLMAFLNSSLENGFHSETGFKGISSNISILM